MGRKAYIHAPMPRLFYKALPGLLILIALAVGCKPKGPGAGTAARPGGYFQTPFQTESEFIVGSIVADVAEQMFYAAHRRLPDQDYFSVTATEKPGSPQDAPVYDLDICLDAKHGDLKMEASINGPIWSPEVYTDVAAQLARAAGVYATGADGSGDTKRLAKLMDASPETIAEQDQILSDILENDFSNPELHEQAALLLGAFALRDHSGHFFDLRLPLSRLTAHLIMAQFLRGDGSFGINGQVAKALSLTLSGDEALALKQLDVIGTNNAAVMPMVRALRARNTGDYRVLGAMDGLSPSECIAWFSALADYVAPTLAWSKLSDQQQKTIDFVRIANEESYSVEMGHQLLDVAIPLEMQEITSVYSLTHQKQLTRDGVIPALNESPKRCFIQGTDGATHVRIIGWSQWAWFLQRHLCHAIEQNFQLQEYSWGVPEDAAVFAGLCQSQFGGLRLYPFVQRFDCTNEATYHQAVDDGFKVTVATPQWVPADCWNYLCFPAGFGPPYQPVGNPHVNEWFNHNPPPGTVYNLNPRLYHPSLTDRSDAPDFFEKLHELAPFDCRVDNLIVKRKYHDKPNYYQAMELYGDLLPYSAAAAITVANTAQDQPKQYEKLLLQAAALDPTCYYTLCNYAFDRHDEDKAAEYDDLGCAADLDLVRVANRATWRVEYYIKKGQLDKARQIAYDAGEVYSARGLEAQATFFELTSNYTEAFQWFAKIEDRYNESSYVIKFCLRHRLLTGDDQFQSELQSRLAKIFPKGMEKVSLADFQGAPRDGVFIKSSTPLLTSAGMQKGDVIVAIGGVRTHDFDQYVYTRDSQESPELHLIVWQSGAYGEITASPPERRFGADFVDYVAGQSN
jgi:hypothetical protein